MFFICSIVLLFFPLACSPKKKGDTESVKIVENNKEAGIEETSTTSVISFEKEPDSRVADRCSELIIKNSQ